MTANLIGCAILLLVIVKSGNAISGREEIKQVQVIGAGNCTYDMDCPGDHPCCVLEDKETVCGQCTSYYKGVCMRCDTRQINNEGERKDSEHINSQMKENCTYDMDCPGEHPCCVLENKETVCGQCTTYYKGVCMRCDTSQPEKKGTTLTGSQLINNQLKGNCTNDQDCPGDHACCSPLGDGTACGICEEYHMGFCTKCHTTGNARHEVAYFKKLDRNNPNSVPDNCTYDMDCPGDHPCCILVDKATMCGKCESYYKGVCMNCNVGGEVDVVLPREKTDIFDPSNCRGNFDCTSPDAPCCKAINIPRPPYVYHFCSQC